MTFKHATLGFSPSTTLGPALSKPCTHFSAGPHAADFWTSVSFGGGFACPLLALIGTLLLALVMFAQTGQDLNWDKNVSIHLAPLCLCSASSIGQRKLRTSWGHSTVSFSSL